MTDIMEVLKAVLIRDCGCPVYYDNLPSNGVDVDSYIKFQRISTFEFFSHTGRSNLHRDRIQVNCSGITHAALLALIDLMETSLYGNTGDFVLAYPLEGSREKSDGAYVYMKDFYIWYH